MEEMQLPLNTTIQIKHAGLIRGPMQVAFDITNKCNFKCLHCFNNSSENDRIENELTDRDVIRFIKDVAKFRPQNLCICGGEPLLRYDLICQIAKILVHNDIIVSMVTNGYLLTLERAVILFKVGISRIQISLDGSNPYTHERLRAKKGSFKKAIEAITLLKKVGFTEIGVAFTPVRFNCHEVKAVFSLCDSLGCTDFRVQPLMALGRAKKNLENLIPTQMQYRNLVRDINELRYENPRKRIEWGDPVDHLIRFRSVTQHLNVFLVVQANGDIVVSPYIPVTIGNIKRYSILKYWNKGLPKVWELEFIKKIADQIKSVPDFSKEHEGQPLVWFDENLKFDLIRDHLKYSNIDSDAS